MKKSLYLAAAAVLALSSPAFAGNDNGPKGGDSSALAGAVAGAAAGAISGSSSNAVGGGAIVTGNNNGGDGGNATSSATGGAGGRADASSSSSLGSLNKFGGDGGSVVGSGNSSNVNANTALSGAYSEGSVSSATGGNATATGGTSSATTGASTSASNSGGNSMTTNVDGDVYEAQARNPVNTAYAAPLSIGGGSCIYTAASVGGSGVSLSLSGSVARRDDECDRRAFADVMARLGDTKAARELLKQNPMVFAAYGVGTGGDAVEVAAPTPAKPPVAAVEAPPAFSFTPMQPIPNPKTPRGE